LFEERYDDNLLLLYFEGRPNDNKVIKTPLPWPTPPPKKACGVLENIEDDEEEKEDG